MKFADSPVITKKEKAYYHKKLEEMLSRLSQESGETVQEMQDSKQEFPDPTDRANFESERNTTLRIRDRERKFIKKIRNALQRLEDNEYNVCQECEGLIGKERLDARPVTALCINCKENEEEREKVHQI